MAPTMEKLGRKWPCGVCGKRVQANSLQCTVCKKWIHKRCSGVHGDLSRVADGFRCIRCDLTIAFVIWETLLMEMVELVLLLQLESEMDG